jgi:citrate lyase subunit beta / citryl-CoA lyase
MTLAQTARTFLFVPATRPDRLEKALATRADAVIIDLEDSVSDEEKPKARENLLTMNPSRAVLVRINAVDTSAFRDDVAALEACPWARTIVVPKVHSIDVVARVRETTVRDRELVALIESAEGISRADEIARSGPSRLLFGTADYAADLNASPSEQLYHYPRSRLVVASAAAGLPGPVDGPSMATRDREQVIADVRTAIALGMGGKLCIHPEQVDVAADQFGPTQEEREWARRIVSAFERERGGVLVVDGEMIDAPVLQRARRILDR